MSKGLDQLRMKLGAAFGDTFQSPEWGAPALMSKALGQVRQQFDSSEASLDERSIARTLVAFRANGSFPTFIDLKYACFGISQRVGRDEWCLIEDAPLFDRLLHLVRELRPEPRRLRKCYQGLMQSYFSYPVLDNDSKAGRPNWEKLSQFLVAELAIVMTATRTPTWLLTMHEHRNLFSNRPCERYAKDLMQGRADSLVAATEGIGIGSTSWVWQEAAIAHTQAVCEINNDDEFKKQLKNLLSLLNGSSDLKLNDTVVVRCVAMVIRRYAECEERPEHASLRELSVDKIGNPWLKRAAWDAYVKDEKARKMVDSWLKKRLIRDFFALLSEDGAADERRLQYWLKFEPIMEDMWFALGSYARGSTSPDFKAIRRHMEGRLHYLDGQGSPYNNAFVFRIGSFMVVEFGVHGNATYIYNAQELVLDPNQRHISIYRLKGPAHVVRLIHNGVWETSFDSWLLPRLNWRPEDASRAPRRTTMRSAPIVERQLPPDRVKSEPSMPVMTKVLDVIHAHKLRYDDKRSKNGAFWILTGDEDLGVNAKLLKLGFKYKARKGWWRE